MHPGRRAELSSLFRRILGSRIAEIASRDALLLLFLANIALLVIKVSLGQCELLTCRGAEAPMGHLLVWIALSGFGICAASRFKSWRHGVLIMLTAGAGYEVTWDVFGVYQTNLIHPQFFPALALVVAVMFLQPKGLFSSHARIVLTIDVIILALWLVAGLPVTVARGLPTALYLDPSTNLIEIWGWSQWLAIFGYSLGSQNTLQH